MECLNERQSRKKGIGKIGQVTSFPKGNRSESPSHMRYRPGVVRGVNRAGSRARNESITLGTLPPEDLQLRKIGAKEKNRSQPVRLGTRGKKRNLTTTAARPLLASDRLMDGRPGRSKTENRRAKNGKPLTLHSAAAEPAARIRKDGL